MSSGISAFSSIVAGAAAPPSLDDDAVKVSASEKQVKEGDAKHVDSRPASNTERLKPYPYTEAVEKIFLSNAEAAKAIKEHALINTHNIKSWKELSISTLLVVAWVILVALAVLVPVGWIALYVNAPYMFDFLQIMIALVTSYQCLSTLPMVYRWLERDGSGLLTYFKLRHLRRLVTELEALKQDEPVSGKKLIEIIQNLSILNSTFTSSEYYPHLVYVLNNVNLIKIGGLFISKMSLYQARFILPYLASHPNLLDPRAISFLWGNYFRAETDTKQLSFQALEEMHYNPCGVHGLPGDSYPVRYREFTKKEFNDYFIQRITAANSQFHKYARIWATENCAEPFGACLHVAKEMTERQHQVLVISSDADKKSKEAEALNGLIEVKEKEETDIELTLQSRSDTTKKIIHISRKLLVSISPHAHELLSDKEENALSISTSDPEGVVRLLKYLKGEEKEIGELDFVSFSRLLGVAMEFCGPFGDKLAHMFSIERLVEMHSHLQDDRQQRALEDYVLRRPEIKEYPQEEIDNLKEQLEKQAIVKREKPVSKFGVRRLVADLFSGTCPA